MQTPYTKDFYDSLQEGAWQSAREIIPLVLEMIQPKSVIDVGCGIGTWLSVFKEFGVEDCLGIDGNYIDPEALQISLQEFHSFDLKQPLQIDRQFDLVVSLEVAEHLPNECAEIFVDSLTRLGSVVLFSAAIPFQGGTEHLNEQWPDYWVRHFQKCNYIVIDCLRKQLWNNKSVEPWYAQNILVFVREDCIKEYPSLEKEFLNAQTSQLAIVHPKIYFNNLAQMTVETRKRTPPAQLASNTIMGAELRLNENRFGSLELEIVAVRLLNGEGFPIAALNSGDSLQIEIEYLAPQPTAPIFGITITREDGLTCYDTSTALADLFLPLLQGRGKVALSLERLDLSSGQYYIDVGVYERNWAYAYDYHWRAYSLLIKPNKSEKGILCPPYRWEYKGASSASG